MVQRTTTDQHPLDRLPPSLLPHAMLPSALLLLACLCLLPALVRPAALTIELPASERACFFADVDQLGEKIGAPPVRSCLLAGCWADLALPSSATVGDRLLLCRPGRRRFSDRLYHPVRPPPVTSLAPPSPPRRS